MKTQQVLIHCLPNYFNAEHRIILSLSNSISFIEIKKVSFSKNKMARKFNFVNQLYNLKYVDFEFETQIFRLSNSSPIGAPYGRDPTVGLIFKIWCGINQLIILLAKKVEKITANWKTDYLNSIMKVPTNCSEINGLYFCYFPS